ncbi:conserved hypothetical protein [Ruegeria lacuscaerulensis ITI-1157]|nr:conserved hypothetical protein [Ruegeria lacuscaerulensis ITI-1157]SHK06317.1 hypothetical protein SAMN05444404_3220 [Ruegeria lacuscaerulensis ITI-1157]
MLRFILTWLTSGPLDRVLDTVDRRVAAETDREKIKGDLIQEHYRQRGDWMRAGGLVLTLLFAVPLAFWFGAVVVYSVFWCHGCAYPQGWTIAALPAPLDEWAGLIIISIFGVIGVTGYRGRK